MKSVRDDSKTNRQGFTLVEMLIVLAIFGILIALAFPNYLKSRAQARKQLCIENLSQIETAKEVWGAEHSKKNGEIPEEGDLIGDGRYIKKLPVCPAGGVYDFEAVGVIATCTIPGHSLPN